MNQLLICILLSNLFFVVGISVLKFMMDRKIDKLRSLIEIGEGPFVSSRMRFPKKVRNVAISGDILSKLHIHKISPPQILHLLHVLKQLTDLPQSAMLVSADLNLSQNAWNLTLSDDSFPEHEEGEQIPFLSLSFLSATAFSRAGVEESKCPTCVLDSMSRKDALGKKGSFSA